MGNWGVHDFETPSPFFPSVSHAGLQRGQPRCCGKGGLGCFFLRGGCCYVWGACKKGLGRGWAGGAARERRALCVTQTTSGQRAMQLVLGWQGGGMGGGGVIPLQRGGQFWLLLGNVTGVRESTHTHTHTNTPQPGYGVCHTSPASVSPYLRRTGGYRSFINRNPPPLQPVLP